MLKKLFVFSLLIFFIACDNDDDNDNNGGDNTVQLLPNVGMALVYENYDLDQSGNRSDVTSIDSLVMHSMVNFDGYDCILAIGYTENPEDNSMSIDTSYIREEGGVVYMYGGLADFSDGDDPSDPLANLEIGWATLYDSNADSWDVLEIDAGIFSVVSTAEKSGTAQVNVGENEHTATSFIWELVISFTEPFSGETIETTTEIEMWYANGLSIVRTVDAASEFNDFVGSESMLVRVYQ